MYTPVLNDQQTFIRFLQNLNNRLEDLPKAITGWDGDDRVSKESLISVHLDYDDDDDGRCSRIL